MIEDFFNKKTIKYRTICVSFLLLLSFTLPVAKRVPEPSNQLRKVVIDTDAGGDDAVAILLLLAAQSNYKDQFDVVAITCVYGNTYEDNVELNVRKILTIAERYDIKIYGGAKEPLTSNFTSDNYFGQDGFGDFEFEETIKAEVDNSKPAAVALVQLAKKYKGSLNILTLGPLTNIAMACELDEDFVDNVETFYVMGGSAHGLGNIRPGLEFNFFMDPVSNFILLRSVRKVGAIVLLPWETVFKRQISKWWRQQCLGKSNSTYIKFLNKVEAISLSKGTHEWTPADAIIAAIMVQPRLIEREYLVNVHAVMTGEAQGSLLIDYANKTKQIRNTRIVDDFDQPAFLALITDYLNQNSTIL